MRDRIYRQEAIDAIEETDWYHQNKNKDMVHGANSAEHQAWYKADDVYSALKNVPSAQPDNQIHLCDSCGYSYPECPCESNDVIFGNGKGNDNICACNKYKPSAQPEYFDYTDIDEAWEYYAKEQDANLTDNAKQIKDAMLVGYRIGLKSAQPEDKCSECDAWNQFNRAITLLKATYSLLKKQDCSCYVLNLLSETVFYDEAECDGSCLMEDIDELLFEVGRRTDE